MSKTASESLYELNLPKTLPDLSGKVPLTMSGEAFLTRFRVTRDLLPREVTVLDPLDTAAYPESAAYEVFVATDGDDAAAGTVDAPLRTLGEAARRVSGRHGATVTLAGGTYAVTEEVLLTAEHSGRAGAPLLIRSKKGQRATLTANTPPSGAWPILRPTPSPPACRLRRRARSIARPLPSRG